MLNLNTNHKSIEVILGGAITTNELPWVSSWAELDTSDMSLTGWDSDDGLTNGASAVTAVDTPSPNHTRQLKFLSLVNVDTAPVTATIQLNNNGTARPVFTAILAVGDCLRFSEHGWHVFTSAGELRVSQ